MSPKYVPLDWKELLGDGESFTVEQVEKAVAGMKLVDLSEGGYVAAEKFETREASAKEKIGKLEAELKELKDAGEGDEALKSRIKTLEADLKAAESKADEAVQAAEDSKKALTSKEREVLVTQKAGHLNAKMQRALLQDAEALVSDSVEFETALAKAMKDDPDYAEPDPQAPKVGTGPPAVRGVDSKDKLDPLAAAVQAKVGGSLT